MRSITARPFHIIKTISESHCYIHRLIRVHCRKEIFFFLAGIGWPAAYFFFSTSCKYTRKRVKRKREEKKRLIVHSIISLVARKFSLLHSLCCSDFMILIYFFSLERYKCKYFDKSVNDDFFFFIHACICKYFEIKKNLYSWKKKI